MDKEIATEVVRILRDVDAPVGDVILPTSTINELRLDSLSFLEFAMKLEDRYGIELNEEELMKCETLGDVIKLVSLQINSREGEGGDRPTSLVG